MRITLFLIILVSTIFIAFPSLDIAFTGLFYTESDGFFLADHIILRSLYDSVPLVTTATIAISVYSIVLPFLQRKLIKKKLPSLPRKIGLILLIALAIGPGLLVNATFKEQWGRARPKNTEFFGGEKQFTPPWVLSEEGGKSFTSGHGSVAFFTTIFAIIASKYKGVLFAITLTYGGLVGLGRIAQGAHFLSDVMLAGLIVFFVNLAVYKLFTEGWWFRKPHPA